MKNVTVKKEDLVGKVSENRDKHRETYLAALEGYKVKARETLERHLKDVENGDIVEIRVNLPKPVSYEHEYDRALEMLSMSVDEEIELSEHDFAKLVMDDWGWKDLFLAANTGYTNLA